MDSQIIKYTYNDQEIEFDLSSQNLMVNATEMAKGFDARINNFFENEGTKRFILACLNNRNSGYLGVAKESDLYVSKQRSGTWMHRILALKFAAWLGADFEVWVYQTIDQLLFGELHRQQAEISLAAQEEAERRRLEAKFGADPEYRRLQSLRAKNTHFYKSQRQQTQAQLNLFADQILLRTEPRQQSEE